MLIPPHIEQRRAAELISGPDQERRPERLVLYAGNEQFDAELQAAAREKWIAAWLYLRHLSTADDASLPHDDPELVRVARLVSYALRLSDDPRHARLRREIRDFLRSRRSGESDNTNG